MWSGPTVSDVWSTTRGEQVGQTQLETLEAMTAAPISQIRDLGKKIHAAPADWLGRIYLPNSKTQDLMARKAELDQALRATNEKSDTSSEMIEREVLSGTWAERTDVINGLLADWKVVGEMIDPCGSDLLLDDVSGLATPRILD